MALRSVASLGGGLSYAFLPRSSFGRIDTDQLNLGLFYLLFGTVLLAGRASSGRASILVHHRRVGSKDLHVLVWQRRANLDGVYRFDMAVFMLRRKLKTTLIGLSAFYIIADLPFSNPLNSSYVQA